MHSIHGRLTVNCQTINPVISESSNFIEIVFNCKHLLKAYFCLQMWRDISDCISMDCMLASIMVIRSLSRTALTWTILVELNNGLRFLSQDQLEVTHNVKIFYLTWFYWLYYFFRFSFSSEHWLIRVSLNCAHYIYVKKYDH